MKKKEHKEKEHKSHSFIRDGINIKELLVIFTYITMCVFYFANTYVLLKLLEKVTPDNAVALVPGFIGFLKQTTIYYTIPYAVIICFYFLSSKSVDLFKTLANKRLPDINIDMPNIPLNGTQTTNMNQSTVTATPDSTTTSDTTMETSTTSTNPDTEVSEEQK